MTRLSGNKAYVALPVAYPRQPGPSQSIGGIKLSRPFVILCCHFRIFVGVPLKEVVPLQVGIEGIRIDWARSCQVCLLLRTKTQPDLARNSLGYIVLDIEDVFRQIVVVLGPQVRLNLHLNKLSGNAYVTSAFAQTVFQHILNGKLASNLI